jgi:hypothetical protein
MLTATMAQAQKHRLTLVSTIGNNISLSFIEDKASMMIITDSRVYWDDKGFCYDMEAGDSIIVDAYMSVGWKYAYLECEGKKIHQYGDENYRGSFAPNWVMYKFIMPDHDATIYVHATFDPDVPNLPNNPNGNRWNASTGELFISGFLPYVGSNGMSSLSSWGTGPNMELALKEFGLTKDNVKKIIVMGEVGDMSQCFMFSSYYPYPNVEVLDLRHAYGYLARNHSLDPYQENALSNLGLDGLPNLKKLILSSKIDKLWSFVWPAHSLLEDVTLYAQVPPEVVMYFSRESFDQLPAGCTLYVPEQSVATYRADSVWNKFPNILPIPEGEAEDITVDLPENYKDGRYMGMSLRLFNTKSGEETKYIIDERDSYIFHSMTCDEPYTAQILNPQDVLVATTDTQTLGNKPIEMTFKHVKKLYDLTLTLQTPAEQEGGTATDVTDLVTIVWTDGMGNRIAIGNTLTRQIEGSRVFYSLSLPSELSAHYGVPPRTELLVKEETTNTTVTLAQPDSVILSGKVTDTEGKSIALATVTASLMMNGTVGKTFTTTADLLGRYKLTALIGDLTLSATARGYVSERVNITVTEEQNTIETIQLVPLSCPTIHYGFTYTASAAADEETTSLPYYSDYANVIVTAYNKTTGEELDSLMVQYPEVQLLSGAKAGDSIRLTASSLKDSFMPVDVIVTLNNDEEKADSVTFDLKELGAIEVSFLRTDNQAVTAALYDADGLLCRQETFCETTLTLSGLKDGDYTVVTIGSDPLLNQLLYLSDYRAVGLTEGTDYVCNKVKVESGIIAEVTNDRIPTLDASPFYYIDDTRTTFMPNKTEVSTSCNVTLRADIAFKESIKERISNVRLLVDFPAGMAEFVEGSSMTGTKMVRATTEDGHLSIPVEKEFLDEPARFILTAIGQGILMASAQVQFELDGREVTQPIGIATCDVKYMTIVAPESIYKLSFPVRGNAPALCPIRVYAGNNLLIGETQSLADGSWNMHVELPACPNLATIPVYAVITTKQGRKARTETVNVTYNKDMIRPLHVYMYPPLIDHNGDYSSVISDAENNRIDFDFDHPENLRYQWYSAYVHIPAPFYFEIQFNTADSSLVKNVILEYQTVKGKADYLRAEYDGNTGRWVCSVTLQEDAVNNVDVDFLDRTEKLFDNNLQFVGANFVNYQKEVFEDLQNAVDSLMTSIGSESNANRRWELMKEYAELIGVDVSGIENEPVDGIGVDEAFAQIERDLADLNFNLSQVLSRMNVQDADFGDGMSVTSAEGFTAERLLSEGYNELKGIDGSMLYEMVDGDMYVLVDLQNNMRMEVHGESAALMVSVRRSRSGDFITDVNRYVVNILTKYAELQSLVELSKFGAKDAVKFFGQLTSSLSRDIAYLMKEWYKVGAPPITDKQLKTLADLGGKKGFLQSVKESAIMLHQDGLDPSQLKHFVVPKTFLGKLMKSSLKYMQAIGEVFSYVAILNDIKEGADRLKELLSIWQDVPDPCEEQQSQATALKNDIENFAYYEMNYFKCLAVADLLATGLVKTGVQALPGTVGTSITEVFSGVGATLVKLAANYLNDETYANKLQHYRGEIDLLDCDEESRKWNEKRRRAALRAETGRPWMQPKVRVAIDPSGYVYEAVADNRVENATATIYFKQTGEDEYCDQHDEVVKWNAEEFRQQNPMLTDVEGKYAWDVPQGLWLVKIEKEGYETAYSDWLPVPPPQLDINIPLVRNTLPDVQTARAYEDGVEVTFNEYMRPKSLTADHILLSQNGQVQPFRIEQQNRSLSYDKKDAYVSRIKVRTESPLAPGSKVQLTVRRQVEAYNGLQMQNDYQQEFTVVSEVYAIGTDSIVEVSRGEERTITIHAFPASAAQGMKVIAKSILGTIATITDEAIFNENGEAHLTVKGKVGGQTALILSLENSKVTAQSIIEVTDPLMLLVYAPTASHISGTYLNEGEAVTLLCDTKDAVIWYTTDGSCPCDENGTRVKYTGPITITKNVTIRAYAVKGEAVSRVVTFNYSIYDTVDIQTTTAMEENDTWYTMGGLKLNKKPTTKGVYITNGQKVMVK